MPKLIVRDAIFESYKSRSAYFVTVNACLNGAQIQSGYPTERRTYIFYAHVGVTFGNLLFTIFRQPFSLFPSGKHGTPTKHKVSSRCKFSNVKSL